MAKQPTKKPQVKGNSRPRKCGNKPAPKAKAQHIVTKPKQFPSKIGIIIIRLKLLETLIHDIHDYAKAKGLHPQTALRGINTSPSQEKWIDELDDLYSEAAFVRDEIVDMLRRLDVLDPLPETCDDEY